MTHPENGAELVHHGLNIAAIAVPLGSMLAHLPYWMSILLMVAGIAWYGVLFYDRFIGGDRK